MSSRNVLLTTEERKVAPEIFQTLVSAKALFDISGIQEVKAWVIEKLEKEKAFEIDYVEIADTKTLLPASNKNTSVILCVAVFLGKTRLIDNI